MLVGPATGADLTPHLRFFGRDEMHLKRGRRVRGGESDYRCDPVSGSGRLPVELAHGGAAVPDRSAAPAGALFLNACHHPPGSFVVPERDQDLVQFHVVEHFVAGRAKALGKAGRMAAGALHKIGDAGAAERREGGPDLDTARAARDTGRESPRLALLAAHQVGGAGGHGVVQVPGIAHGDHGAVIRHVQPFVRVDRPGIRIRDAACEMRAGVHGPVYSIPASVGDGRMEMSVSATADHSLFVFHASTFDHPMEIYAAKPGKWTAPGLKGVTQAPAVVLPRKKPVEGSNTFCQFSARLA